MSTSIKDMTKDFDIVKCNICSRQWGFKLNSHLELAGAIEYLEDYGWTLNPTLCPVCTFSVRMKYLFWETLIETIFKARPAV